MTSESPLRDFVSRHKVCWEVEPLREMVKDEGVRPTGLEFNLFAQCLPPPAGTDPSDWLLEVHARTAEVAEQVLSKAAPGMILDVEAPHVETHLRPETEWADEIEVRVELTPPDPDAPPSPEGLKALVAAVEQGMAALGVHRKSWTEHRR